MLPHTTWEALPRALSAALRLGPSKPLAPMTQNTGQVRRLRTGLALNLTLNVAPHLLSEEAGAQVSQPGQGPGRTHLPACGRQDPLTSAAPTPNRHR